jgi:hypothetical protein
VQGGCAAQRKHAANGQQIGIPPLPTWSAYRNCLPAGASYTPPVGDAGMRGRLPRLRRVSSWAAAHEFHCFCFFSFFLFQIWFFFEIWTIFKFEQKIEI